MKKPTVFVGLSGGVDSSVAAARLLNEGYHVVGVFIKVWHPDFLICNWEEERVDAMRVAAHLGIPFLTCDAEEAYREQVAKDFIASYQAGLTPNPDVLCNREVKFGTFLEFALERGADFIATGHYAEIQHGPEGNQVFRGQDTNKDQSYFLWAVTNEQFSKVLLPVGNSPKSKIRAEAEAWELPTAAKKDSQGICFLGHVDIPQFLSHYVNLEPGKVTDKTGQTIGHHQGALVYTLGQRHGFTITAQQLASTPLYVAAKDLQKNIIIVDTKPPQYQLDDSITLRQINLLQPLPETVTFQTRYRQTPQEARVVNVNHTEIILQPHTPGLEKAAAGQSCVLYNDRLLLGGGIIV